MIKASAWKGKRRQAHKEVDEILEAADKLAEQIEEAKKVNKTNEEAIQRAKEEGTQVAVVYSEAVIYKALIDTHKNWGRKALKNVHKRADEISEGILKGTTSFEEIMDELKDMGVTF